MVSLSYNSLTTLINREDLSAFTSFLNNRNVAVDDRDDVSTEQGTGNIRKARAVLLFWFTVAQFCERSPAASLLRQKDRPNV